MLKSGICTNAQRRNDRTRVVGWCEVDIVDLSDEEFAKWWLSITDEKDKFYTVNTLRKLSHSLSDYGDSETP